MFGDSWQSDFEKNIQVLAGGKQLRYWRGDGSAWFFTQSQNTWTLASPTDERATDPERADRADARRDRDA